MKKFTILISALFTVTSLYSQDYQITFAGEGASTTVNSVIVENLTKGSTITINGDDILVLTGAALGINELDASTDNELSIYPNPMLGFCSFDFETAKQSLTTIGLYDLAGKRILLSEEQLNKGHHTYKLSGIPKGTYLLNIASDYFSYSIKIVSLNETFGIADIKHISSSSFKYNNSDNTEVQKSWKRSNAEIEMEYTTGDRLKFKGISGNYSTIKTDIPTENKTIIFDFIDCTDGDNNHYPIVKIGTQIWMAENLKTSKYADGTAIPLVNNNTSWASLSDNDTDDAYCYYNDDANSIYGALYTNAAAMNGAGSSSTNPSGVQGVCPDSWHLPSSLEWWELRGVLGLPTAAGKMKETGTEHWASPNTGATNESGFTALPGGDRRPDNGTFRNMYYGGAWHTTYHQSTTNVLIINLVYLNEDISAFYLPKSGAYSVRCVKD